LVGINNPAAFEVVVASSVAVEVIVFVWCEVVVEVSVEVEERVFVVMVVVVSPIE
jgi:hypothetical protein